MQRPNLFLIGEQKAGTTSLHQMLAAHPDIFMTQLKEPGFFCTDFHEESDTYHGKKLHFPYRDVATYMKLFSGWTTETYGGESSSLYFYSTDAPTNISRFNQNSKIIIILRDPTTFLPSLHTQYLKEQTEDVQSLERALDLESIRSQGKSIPLKVKAPSLLLYSKRIQYGVHLENVYNEIPKDAVHVVFFEDFIHKTNEVYSNILRFLGVDSSFDPPSIRANPSSQRRFLQLYSIMNDARLKSLILRTTPLTLQLAIKRTLDGVFLKTAPKLDISQALRSRIQNMALPGVLYLEDVLGRKTPWDWVHAR